MLHVFFSSFLSLCILPSLPSFCMHVHDEPKPPRPSRMSGHTKGTVSLLPNQYPRTARQLPPPLCQPPSGPTCALSGLICRGGGIAFLCTPLGDLLVAVYLAPVICHIPDERSGACEMPPRR